MSVTPVDNQLKYYNERNIDKFLGNYSDSIRLYDLKTGDLISEGKLEMRTRFSDLFSKSPNLNAEIKKRIVLGNTVIDHENVSGFRGDQAIEAIAIYEIQDNLIDKVWFVR